MKRLLAFILAAVVFLSVHEAMHVWTASFYHEFETLRLRPIGPEVIYKTAVEERSGRHWALISGASSVTTLSIGYLLLLFSRRLARLSSRFLKSVLFYLTTASLVVDPFNLSFGPFLYGGDAEGIAVGLGVNRYLVQAFFLAFLLVNREVVIHKLFPLYRVSSGHLLFRPLLFKSKGSNR